MGGVRPWEDMGAGGCVRGGRPVNAEPNRLGGAPVCVSGETVDSHSQRRADLVYPLVAETTETLSERTERDAFDRIEIHCQTLWNRVAVRFEDDFAREATDVGCARSNQGAPEPGDRNVARQDNDRTAGDLGQFAPPGFSRLGYSFTPSSRPCGVTTGR